MIIYIMIFIGIIFLIGIYIFLSYKNKICFLQIKIDVAEKSIDSLMDKNLDLLKKSCKRLDDLTEEDLFEEAQTLERNDYSSFEFNKKLSSLQRDFEEEVTYRKNFIPDEETINLFQDLRITHLECEASQDFYNDTVSSYNNLLNKFPVNIIGKMLKCCKKELYSFEEEEVFEILKESNN